MSSLLPVSDNGTINELVAIPFRFFDHHKRHVILNEMHFYEQCPHDCRKVKGWVDLLQCYITYF